MREALLAAEHHPDKKPLCTSCALHLHFTYTSNCSGYFKRKKRAGMREALLAAEQDPDEKPLCTSCALHLHFTYTSNCSLYLHFIYTCNCSRYFKRKKRAGMREALLAAEHHPDEKPPPLPQDSRPVTSRYEV